MDPSSSGAPNSSKALFSLLHDRPNHDPNPTSQAQAQSQLHPHLHPSGSQGPSTQDASKWGQHDSTANHASKLEKKGFLSGPFQFLDHRARRGSVSDTHDSTSSTPANPQTSSSSAETGRFDTTMSGNPATPQQTRPPPAHLRPTPIAIYSPASRSSLAAAPCSPKTDPTTAAVYASASPASVLPRHSRGLDFSRAATQLHHSMLADASPDTSPVVATRAMAIPPGRRRSNERWNSMSGSPGGGGGGMMPSERLGGAGAGSISSINMLDIGSTDSSEDDDYDETDEEEEGREREEREQEDDDGPFQGDEMMLSTPRLNRPQNIVDGIVTTSSSSTAAFLPNMMETPSAAAHTMPNPALAASAAVLGAANSNNPPTTTASMTPRSGTKASFKNYQRNRQRHGRGRHHLYHQGPYQNATKYNSNAGSLFPGVLRSVETAAGGHFPAAAAINWDGHRSGSNAGSEMQYSDMSDDETKPQVAMGSPSSIATNANPEPGRPGVIRKAITRPRNLMPKPKPFNRIRAQLLEENAPIDFDVKREAEVIRQVRESEPDPQPTPSSANQSQTPNRSQDLDHQSLPPNSTSHAQSNPDREEREPSFPFSSFSQDLKSSISPGALANPPAFSLSGNAEGGTAGGGGVGQGGEHVPPGGIVTSVTSGASGASGAGTGTSRSPRYETPPPPPSRHSSDVFMETDTPPPLSGIPGVNATVQQQQSQQSQAQSQSQSQTTGATGLSNASTSNAVGARTPSAAGLPFYNTNTNPNKRRRDDFMDFNTFKRRAVSPSVSVVSAQSSPKVAPFNRPGSISSESGNNSFGGGNGANNSGMSGSLKRVGLQGMKETNDGFMNMRID